MSQPEYYIYDPRNGYINSLGYKPQTELGFLFWRGELREIYDVHETTRGFQIELYSHRVW